MLRGFQDGTYHSQNFHEQMEKKVRIVMEKKVRIVMEKKVRIVMEKKVRIKQ
jgi:hypothetical protein